MNINEAGGRGLQAPSMSPCSSDADCPAGTTVAIGDGICLSISQYLSAK